jgi:hypothetical protein
LRQRISEKVSRELTENLKPLEILRTSRFETARILSAWRLNYALRQKNEMNELMIVHLILLLRTAAPGSIHATSGAIHFRPGRLHLQNHVAKYVCFVVHFFILMGIHSE